MGETNWHSIYELVTALRLWFWVKSWKTHLMISFYLAFMKRKPQTHKGSLVLCTLVPFFPSTLTSTVIFWDHKLCSDMMEGIVFSLAQNCCWPVTGDPQGQALCQHAYCDAESSGSQGIIMDMRIFIMQWGMIKQRDHSGRPKNLQGTLISPWCWSEIMNWTQQRSTFTSLIWRLCPFLLDIMKAGGKSQDWVFLGRLFVDVSTHDDANH